MAKKKSWRLPKEFHFGLALSISSNEKTGGTSVAGVGAGTALARIRRHDFLR